MKKTKFIFVTGGVLSSLGKGLAAASIAALLESRDPYINVDPGTLSPFQHGEVFVTDDGAETDLDLGHYERFSSTRMAKCNNLTSGQVYFSVISKERKGEYLGKTVQVIPHVTDEIKDYIKSCAVGRSWKSAGPSETLRASPFWKRSGNFATKWENKTPYLYT